ncbi:MAG: TIGR02530 family flagellar biosynthesis protein [Bacillota bacterium]
MPDRIRIGDLPEIRPIAPKPSTGRPGPTGEFSSILQEKVKESELKISAHAGQRLASAGRTLTDRDMQRLCTAVDLARQKGCRESLVIMDDLALIVSVKNQVVVTAISTERMKENVFTNIDSAVII